MANGYLGDQRIREMESLMRQMCQRKGYDLDTAFKGLLDYLLWIFDPEGNKPEGWRFDAQDSEMFLQMSQAWALTMERELKAGQWYDAFGDLYMALHTAAQQDFTAEKAAEEGLRRLKAIKKLGMERSMTMLMGIHLGYIRILEDILHIEIDMNQSAVIAQTVGDNAEEIVKKWVDVDFSTDELNAAFERDLIDCYCRCARAMKLKHVNRDTITAAYKDIIADVQRVTREYAEDA